MRSLPEESGIRDDKAGCVTNSLQRAGGTPALLANRGRLSGLLRLISLIGTDRVGSARRAHPVRGKGRAHLTQNPEGYEPSFSLIRADSRRSYERKVVMDAKELPALPSLEQYKKQAKDLLKACKAGNPEAVQQIKEHHPLEQDVGFWRAKSEAHPCRCPVRDCARARLRELAEICERNRTAEY